jgi:glycosyltransferase involved in cell wall biosynthesis
MQFALKNSMRIAQVAPLFESVPPRLYGGTERVVSILTEELVRQGHSVTLFASGDSRTRGQLNAICENSLRLNQTQSDGWAFHCLQLDRVARLAHLFDIIHFHTDYFHFPLSRALSLSQITTLHGRLDTPGLSPLYDEFSDMPVVSISNAQRKPLPRANWVGTVHHGLPSNLYTFHGKAGHYLAFLGRVSPEKRLDRAIEVAKAAQIKIRIAAKVDIADQDYFEKTIQPLLDHPLVEFVGEIDDAQKSDFLGNAIALLFPIDWPEPFGLVMIESMACGTPVIAWRCGSVPEIIESGRTGFIVDNTSDAIAAVHHTISLDRSACRQAFEKRFSVKRMASEYVEIYESIIRSKLPASQAGHVRRSKLHLGQLSPSGAT